MISPPVVGHRRMIKQRLIEINKELDWAIRCIGECNYGKAKQALYIALDHVRALNKEKGESGDSPVGS